MSDLTDLKALLESGDHGMTHAVIINDPFWMEKFAEWKAAHDKYAALTSPETVEKVAKELKRAALDNLGWSDQARAALRAVTEDTE